MERYRDLYILSRLYLSRLTKSNFVIVYNGEVYNYLEIRKNLVDADFNTASDCEAPLHLYRSYGLDFVE